MNQAKSTGLTRSLGIAPGPANGFSLDLIGSFERFGDLIDWAMLILNPLEPWPVGLTLPACEQHGVKVMTRVVDHGGVFHDDLGRPGHEFKAGDHRSYRPEGWVEHGMEKANRMRPIAEKHGLSLLQFACIWNLSHPAVESVVPTFIQEAGDAARPIEEKIREFGALPDIRLSPEEVESIRAIGDNTGCMMLKGASQRHQSSERPDEWPMRQDLLELADRYALGRDW
jgi:aryl-alcohol dehydrogenase-like predicted oxidoreductase